MCAARCPAQAAAMIREAAEKMRHSEPRDEDIDTTKWLKQCVAGMARSGHVREAISFAYDKDMNLEAAKLHHRVRGNYGSS